ncbi:hypothetical protein GWI33_021418 [Rhynchophorus ferrugineus]|uniref:Transposable element Tc3 transposase n=1 Tax=Rhynchophorus ferrugineus TaxID=354439 RepID=A0A834MIE9_RHYFE|nr:hypothetical protein GWI33_021418 [Rhynchophorus ferrugineus]
MLETSLVPIFMNITKVIHPVNVTAGRYQDMIRNFLVPGTEEQGLEDIWFQQDGVTAHTAPRSPNLTTPDFFLWGFLKSKAYVNKPQTIQHLKDNVCHEIEDIQRQMLQDVMKNAFKRAESCIASRGHQLADIIFQS